MATRKDPLSAFNFCLTLVDSARVDGTLSGAPGNYEVAGFSECSGLEALLEVLEFKEGGRNDHVLKFPTRASFTNISLKHGVIYQYEDLWKWHHGFVVGTGKRKDGRIVLLDEARQQAKVWKFKRGIPTKWIGPALNAAQSNVAIEALEISHEGLELEEGA